MNFDWTKTARDLSPAALTVRAQVVSPNDDGKLIWDIYFPRQPSDSIKLSDILTPDHRPAADRREWNGKGRRIHHKTPNVRDVEMLPIEMYDPIDEREIQILNERALFNQQVVQAILQASIPRRGEALAAGCYRRLELDTFEAWLQGTLTQRNPEDATKIVTVTFGFDANRYQTPAVAWNNGAVNSYNELVQFLREAQDATGGVEGVMLRLATMLEIERDAPTYSNGIRMTRKEMQQNIEDTLGFSFYFEVMERTVDVYNDGGVETTRTKIFPAEKVAAIPSGKVVGGNYFAKVVRAMEISQNVPGAGVDENGVTVYTLGKNDGKELEIQAQLNAMPVPDEGKVFVWDVGV